MSNRRIVVSPFVLIALWAGFVPVFAQTPIKLVTFPEAQAIAGTNCAACHDWANSGEGILSVVEPGKPERSPFYVRMADGSMPPSGKRISKADLALVRDWISQGAMLSAPEGTASVDAVSGATIAEPVPAEGKKSVSVVPFHRVSGFASSGLLLAAGAVGGYRFLDLINRGHDICPSGGEGDENDGSAVQTAGMMAAWADPQAQWLRWTHVGLLVSGGSLYLANGITGGIMLSPEDPGLSRRDLHRYTFFAHAGMMISEAVMGLFLTDALSRGDHELVRGLTVAHAVLGVAAPLTILGSGLIFSIPSGP